MRQFHNDTKIMTHVFLSCVVIAVLLLLSVQPAIADYNFDGVPFRDCLYEEVKQGSLKEGGVYVDGGHGVGPSPYTQSFNVPGGEVKWARLYVGVWGGNEQNTGSVDVTFNSQEIDILELKGESDTNPNVYCSGHGVYWIYYDVTDKTTSGPVDAVVTTSGDIDGRVYGIVLVAVYEEPDGEEVKYWINEGNVNLHAGDLKTNNEAVAEFTDTVDVDKFAIARLTVVYLAGTPGLNDYLYFNDEKLCDGDNCDDMANSKQSFDIKTFDLIEQLENKANKAKFELGDEDYVRPVLAVLTLHTEEEGDSVLTVSSVNVPAAAQEPEINGYAADKPLSTFSHDTIKGGLTYTIGDSYYSGKLWTNETYTVHCDVALPEGAVLEFARLYNYWTWSAKGTTGRYPDMMVTFNGVKLEPDRQYSDRKGWGIYDYPTGTWVYDVTDHITESGSYTAVVENTGPDGSFFSMNGVGLLVVYKDEEGKYIEYWVNEGCDMPYSGLEDDGTSIYTTPDQTITEMMTPTISHDPIGKATLWTIVQSGNWDANRLWVNDMDWSGICDGTPYPDLDIDIRDITGHLAVGKNTIRFQAVEDYAVPSGSFLVVEIEPTAEGASASKGIPGFEAMLLMAAFLTVVSLFKYAEKRRK
jgi:hypothetical protein